jgi:hypothetical protein
MKILPLIRPEGSHSGYAVYKVIGKFNNPTDRIGIYAEPDRAVKKAEDLEAAETGGTQYRAFRIIESPSGIKEPKEIIKRDDLPVTEGLNPTPNKNPGARAGALAARSGRRG